ncbi:hypothetical protein DH86_00001967 [Scytalidium sp. 3C]|nr:hypothetical protein DH86_00001967 [Scytalidium sp. 3C]
MSSEGEDLLGEDTPNETDEQTSNSDQLDDLEQTEPISEPVPTAEVIPEHPIPVSTTTSASLPEATLRARSLQTPTSQPPTSTKAAHTTATQLFPSAATTAAPSLSTATKESLLSHNRHEQEALTTSMLSMAQALKSSSMAFSDSLDSEQAILGRTSEGLEKNKSGLDAAQSRMGVLRKMSEGKGWWGRIMLYAWIFGLWVAALVIVFVLPKLRF